MDLLVGSSSYDYSRFGCNVLSSSVNNTAISMYWYLYSLGHFLVYMAFQYSFGHILQFRLSPSVRIA